MMLERIIETYPGLTWQMSNDGHCTGKIDNTECVCVYAKNMSEFIVYEKSAKILLESGCIDEKEDAYNVLKNAEMIFYLPERKEALKKICMIAEQAIKKYYILQKKELINAESKHKLKETNRKNQDRH